METSQMDYRISLKDVVFGDTVRRTEHVVVYSALWRHQPVCVKEIVDEKRSVFREISILTKCIHPNIVQFLGFSGKYMMFEYMDHGDLREYVMKHKTRIDPKKRLSMMKDITIGLHYLHNRTPFGIFHRDLKPENILVNRYGDVKIADFDVSKLVNTEDTKVYHGHTGETGTYTWVAPEVLNHEKYNYTADIYSLGLLFYFIWNFKTPFEDMGMSVMQIAFAKVHNTIQIPTTTDNPFINSIISQCCSHDKDERPDTERVIKLLSHVISSLKEHNE